QLRRGVDLRPRRGPGRGPGVGVGGSLRGGMHHRPRTVRGPAHARRSRGRGPAAVVTARRQPTRAPVIALDEVRAAATRLRGVVHRTPVLTTRTLDELTGASVLLKA